MLIKNGATVNRPPKLPTMQRALINLQPRVTNEPLWPLCEMLYVYVCMHLDANWNRRSPKRLAAIIAAKDGCVHQTAKSRIKSI